MPGTPTGTIGNNAGVMFTYNGTGAGLHLDIGFQPSHAYFEASTTTLAWSYFAPFPYARVATAASCVNGAGGVGQTIGTATSVASVQGIQVGTDTTINGAGITYRGYAWR